MIRAVIGICLVGLLAYCVAACATPQTIYDTCNTPDCGDPVVITVE